MISAHRKILAILCCCALLQSCANNAKNQIELETAVCGVQEPFLFWLWSNIAGRPDASNIEVLANVEDISFQTTDGRVLRGYRLKARTSGSEGEYGRAFLLVAQGNAMLADQIMASFSDYASAGIDVYIFDFRGYGRSEGKRRLQAMVNDYGELIDLLNSRPYAFSLYYGMSFGGILLLNALQEREPGDRIVIDSSPSRLSDYGCPDRFDAVSNLPEHASNLLFIAGARDPVVTPSMSKELAGLARARGATVMKDPQMAHPFMDSTAAIHDRRLEVVRSFLLQALVGKEE